MIERPVELHLERRRRELGKWNGQGAIAGLDQAALRLPVRAEAHPSERVHDRIDLGRDAGQVIAPRREHAAWRDHATDLGEEALVLEPVERLRDDQQVGGGLGKTGGLRRALPVLDASMRRGVGELGLAGVDREHAIEEIRQRDRRLAAARAHVDRGRPRGSEARKPGEQRGWIRRSEAGVVGRLGGEEIFHGVVPNGLLESVGDDDGGSFRSAILLVVSAGRLVSSGDLRKVVAFVRLGRPQFLVGGFLLYGLGAAVAVLGGASWSARAYALGQAAVTAIQLMTHYANDYFDLAADRANLTPTRWSGGSRVLASGALPDDVARTAAGVLLAVAAVLVVAVHRASGPGGPAAAAALLGALALAWMYSAPPVRLHSRGLGELTTALVVTGLVPVIGFVLQAGATRGLAPLLLAQIPLAGLQFGMLLAIELPDAAGDAAVGKRTLVVRLGGRRSAALYRAWLVAVYGTIPLLLLGGLPPLVALAAAVGAPVGAWQFHRLGRGAWAEPDAWEGTAFRAVVMLVATSAAELAACLWLMV